MSAIIYRQLNIINFYLVNTFSSHVNPDSHPTVSRQSTGGNVYDEQKIKEG